MRRRSRALVVLAMALMASSIVLAVVALPPPPPVENRISVVLLGQGGLVNAKISSARLYLAVVSSQTQTPDGTAYVTYGDGFQFLENMTVGAYPDGTSTGILHSARAYPQQGTFELILTVDGAVQFYSFDLSQSHDSDGYWVVLLG